DDGPTRTCSSFCQLSQGSGQFHHGCGSAARVDAAEDPGIAVIAKHDPFIGQLRAANATLDHIVGLSGVVHLDLDVNAHSLAAEVVLDRKSALPVIWSDWAVHMGEQRFGVVPGKWQRHDLWDRHCLLDRNSFGARHRGPSRSERIAGHHEIVCDGAALDVILRTPGAFGDDLTFLVSVFGWIAVDENSGCAFAFGGERFESAVTVGIRVADEDNFTFDVDTLLAEKFVIFGIAAVSVDEWRGYFARSGHTAPRQTDALVLHVRVSGDGQLAEAGAVMHG